MQTVIRVFPAENEETLPLFVKPCSVGSVKKGSVWLIFSHDTQKIIISMANIRNKGYRLA